MICPIKIECEEIEELKLISFTQEEAIFLIDELRKISDNSETDLRCNLILKLLLIISQRAFD